MTELQRAADAWRKAKRSERAAAEQLHKAIRRAVSDGMSEAEVARVAGVNRMTVRRALGK